MGHTCWEEMLRFLAKLPKHSQLALPDQLLQKDLI